MRGLLRVYATGIWTGFFPVAPGTAGCLLAVALYAAVPWLPLGSDGVFSWGPIAFIVLAILVGLPAARRGEEEFGADGGPIVIDEIVGQWITLLCLPPTPFVLAGGFLLFRIADILKPFPSGASQRWGRGWGVMADDVFAGIYAAIALRLLLTAKTALAGAGGG